MAQRRIVVSALAVAVAVADGGSAGCVGEDPDPAAPAPDAATDGGGGGGSDAPTESGEDAGPTATGDFVWALDAQKNVAVDAVRVATNAAGEIAVVAKLNGATSVGGIPVAAPPGDGALVFKLKSDKTVSWAASLPANPLRVAIDAPGNVYVAGSFVQDQTIGAVVLDSQNALAESPASFVLRMRASDGVAEWGTTLSRPDGATAPEISECNGLAVRGGDLAVACEFAGGAGFDAISGPEVRTSDGQRDALVLLLDAATGTARWSKHVRGLANELTNEVIFDADGNVLVVGEHGSPTVSVDGAPAIFTSNGGGRGYVLRFDATAPHATTLGASWGDPAAVFAFSAIAELPGGDLVLCGGFNAPVNVGSEVVASKGNYDAMVMRIDRAGTVKWIKTWGGDLFDRCFDLAADDSGNVVVAGAYRSASVRIGMRAFPDPVAGQSGGLVAKLDGTGAPIWGYGHAAPAGASGSSNVGGAALLPSGDVIVGGSFSGTIDLGGGAVQSANGGTQASVFVVRRTR